MKRTRTTPFGSERGATLALVAVSMIVILAVAALAIDLAAAFSWRAEAQKIADSAALAGASAFLDEPDLALVTPIANERAYEYALLHTIRKEFVDSSEVTVQVIPDTQKVRVYINRQNLSTWFARILGVGSIDIGAVSAAQAFSAGEATCLKPVVLPDLWDENDSDDGDNIWQEGEEWEYNPETDRYQRWDGPDDPDGASATGYGSQFRQDLNADRGRRLVLKPQSPQSEYVAQPGLFMPWAIPPDPNQGTCDQGGGGGGPGGQGGANYRNNWCECNNTPIQLDTPIYLTEPGNMIGPTNQGVGELLDEDPGVEWRPELGPDGAPGRFEDGEWVEVTSSPRIIKVAMMDPGEWEKGGRQAFEFNNFALLFLEGFEGGGAQADVIARFLYYAGGSGEGAGPTQGSLVKFLQLVE